MMTLKSYSSIIFFSVLILYFCGKGVDRLDSERMQDSDYVASSYMVNSRGDSIVTGVPIKINGKSIHVESILVSDIYTREQGRGKVKLVPEEKIVTPPNITKTPKLDTGHTIIHTSLTKFSSLGQSDPVRYPIPIEAMKAEIATGAKLDIRYWGIDQNMASASIWTMIQDRRGDFWFGSLGNGVIRFDGERFNHFSESEGIGHHFVYAICEDSKGNIWFGTGGGGVTRFDGQSFTRFKTEHGLAHNIVLSIIEDHQGTIWFGTRGGLCSYDGREFTHYTTKEGLVFNEVISIYEDSKHHLWVGTGEGSGLHRFDGQRFIHFDVGEGIGDNDVHAILEDQNGDMWFGTWGGGLIRYDGSNLEKYTTEQGLPGNSVLSIVEDHEGALWFGIMGGGVTKYDGRSFTNYTEDVGLSSNDVRFLFEDDKKNIWACTWNNGVNRINPRGFQQIDLSGDLDLGEVYSFTQSKNGYKWMNTSSGLLKLDNNQLSHLTNKESIIDQRVSAIFEDRDGNIWLGSQGGVSVFSKSGIKDYTRENGLMIGNVRTIIQDKKGHIWFATYAGGVLRYDGHKFTQFMEENGFVSDDAFSLFEDSRGRLWIGTQGGGVCRYDGKNFTIFTTGEGLSHNSVRSILEDNQGNMWFGTEKGLTKYDGTTFEKYFVQDGLVHNKIFSMFMRNHKIYISTQKGISIFSPEHIQFSNLEKSDELGKQNLSIGNILIDEHNKLWVGNIGGALIFDLDQFERSDKTPLQLKITDIKINNESIDYRNLYSSETEIKSFSELEGPVSFSYVDSFYNLPIGLKIPYQFNHLTFYSSATNWNTPGNVQYSFLLEGIDKEWSMPQVDGSMDYRNLPYGNYTLTVRAVDSNGIWSDPIFYTFTITPPWYHSWIAYAIYLLLGFLALYYLYNILLTRKIAIAESRRLKDLDELKTNIYTNITHEFRTPLTIINGMAGELEKFRNVDVHYKSGMIKRNSQQLLNMVNQMLKLSKLRAQKEELNIQQADIILFIKYLVSSYESISNSKEISLDFFSETSKLFMDFDADKVETILSNLISNALKFTDKNGTILVNAKQVEVNGKDCVKIAVKDSGIGIAAVDIRHVFDRFHQVSGANVGQGTGIGLAIVKELVILMNGSIEVESAPGEGSQFVVYLPMERNASFSAELPLLRPKNLMTNSQLVKEKEIAVIHDDTLPVLQIIEDNSDVVEYLKHCLKDDYSLLISRDGDQGISDAIQTIPDIIISDVMMNGKDGFELCEILKVDKRTSHIPIVLLTAKVTAEDKLRGLASGADAYLPKPFEKEELFIRLENLLLVRKNLQQKYLEELKKQRGPSPIQGGPGNNFTDLVERIIFKNLSNEDFSVNELCGLMHLSRSQLNRKIKAYTGMSTSLYIRHIRLLEAQRLLKNSDLTVKEILYQVGFNSPAYFSLSYKNLFGHNPSAERRSSVENTR